MDPSHATWFRPNPTNTGRSLPQTLGVDEMDTGGDGEPLIRPPSTPVADQMEPMDTDPVEEDDTVNAKDAGGSGAKLRLQRTQRGVRTNLRRQGGVRTKLRLQRMQGGGLGIALGWAKFPKKLWENARKPLLVNKAVGRGQMEKGWR